MSLRAGRPGLLALTAALAVLLAAAAPVLAHAELVSSDPADGATLPEPPTTITLTFSEGLDASRSSFRLNKDGANIATGQAAASGDTTMTLTGLDLEPGHYVIRWTSSADDGHLERGSLSFTVLEPSPTPDPTETPAPTPTPGPSESAGPSPTTAPTSTPVEPSAIPSAVPSASPDPGNTGSPGTGDVVLPIALALAIVAGVGAYVLRRSRRA